MAFATMGLSLSGKWFVVEKGFRASECISIYLALFAS